MPRGLILAHMQNTRYIHGGAVYRESIRSMLLSNDPRLTVDELFVHDQQHPYRRLLRQVVDVLRSPLSRYPAKVNHFISRDFRQRLTAYCAAGDYQLFVINGAEMLWCLDWLPAEATVLFIAHNIEHLLYQQQVAKYAGLPLLGRLLAADAEKFKRFELHNLRRLERIVSIAQAEEELLRSYCRPEARVVTIQPSFSYAPHQRRPAPPGTRLRLGFLGNLEWWPNRRSLDWFLTEVWPRLGPEVELHLYGQGSLGLGDGQRLHGHGFVKALSQVWDQVELMIQPIVCGAGVNIKVAESLYNRMPMVATPCALRGLGLEADPAVKTLDGAAAWIDYLTSPAARDQTRLQVRPDNAALFSLDRNRAALQGLMGPP